MTQPASEPHTQRRVLLQPSGEGKALFVFPGIHGTPQTFADLAMRLGTERPVYGFHLVGTLQECEPVRQMGRLAQLYAAEVRSAQPRGPYFLFGYSFGGAVAFEVARELLAHGERVGLVVMADCPAPGYPKPAPAWSRIRTHVQNLLTLSPAQRLAYVRERFANGIRRLERMVGITPEATATAEHDTIPLHLKRVDAALYEAYQHYDPAPLSVDVLFLTADSPPDWPTIVYDDPLLGWGSALRGRLTQCGVPGAHLSIFASENVPVLVGRMQDAIAAAERAERAQTSTGSTTLGAS
jgi:thioesterase domain-containing protein